MDSAASADLSMLQCASYALSHGGLRRHVTVLHAIANLTLPQLGYADVVKPAPLLDNPRQTTDIFDGLELKSSDGTRLLLGSTIFHQYGIICRGTCVARARRVEKGKDSGTDDDAWGAPSL